MLFEVSGGVTWYTYTEIEYDKTGNKTAVKVGKGERIYTGLPVLLQ
jgi:hypothetical protein